MVNPYPCCRWAKCWSRSYTVHDKPRWRAAVANARPAKPPPTTAIRGFSKRGGVAGDDVAVVDATRTSPCEAHNVQGSHRPTSGGGIAVSSFVECSRRARLCRNRALRVGGLRIFPCPSHAVQTVHSALSSPPTGGGGALFSFMIQKRSAPSRVLLLGVVVVVVVMARLLL
eukprot:scaffold353_cov185-Amphora_coffeaeformis.AAC.37